MFFLRDKDKFEVTLSKKRLKKDKKKQQNKEIS